ncbi:MAG: twin-arginine translocase TatA/TatE family subunit [Actinomycetota bacterium]|nr:twin-arginine translocase TatA/TatE family subunit [Actinomycetota bacterium]
MTSSVLLAEIIGPDLLIVLVIVALLFGSTRLPKLARSLGSAKAEFEKGINEGMKPAPESEERVTMTQAELDTLVAQREAQARADHRQLGP